MKSDEDEDGGLHARIMTTGLVGVDQGGAAYDLGKRFRLDSF